MRCWRAHVLLCRWREKPQCCQQGRASLTSSRCNSCWKGDQRSLCSIAKCTPSPCCWLQSCTGLDSKWSWLAAALGGLGGTWNPCTGMHLERKGLWGKFTACSLGTYEIMTKDKSAKCNIMSKDYLQGYVDYLAAEKSVGSELEMPWPIWRYLSYC